jgi:hypothetical protein
MYRAAAWLAARCSTGNWPASAVLLWSSAPAVHARSVISLYSVLHHRHRRLSMHGTCCLHVSKLPGPALPCPPGSAPP